MAPLDLPPPTICDMNCFLEPGHDGPHQFTPERRAWEQSRGVVMADREQRREAIARALLDYEHDAEPWGEPSLEAWFKAAADAVLAVLGEGTEYEQVGSWNEMMGAHNADEDCPIVECEPIYRFVRRAGEGTPPTEPPEQKNGYQIALRPDEDGLLDDVVVTGVTMFRMEHMTDTNWWACCYLDNDDRICWSIDARNRPLRCEATTTEYPHGVVYEDGSPSSEREAAAQRLGAVPVQEKKP